MSSFFSFFLLTLPSCWTFHRITDCYYRRFACFGETYEALSSILTFLSHDGKEGMQAFFEKRKPDWKGE